MVKLYDPERWIGNNELHESPEIIKKWDMHIIRRG